MTTKGRDMLRLFSSSYASSSSAKVPMWRTRTECLFLTLEAEEENMSAKFVYNSFVTGNKERNKKEKVGDHLQDSHPQCFLQNRVVALPVILRSPLLFWVHVDVKVFVDVWHLQ